MSTILVVDDEVLITLMVEDWLTELGHTVVGPAQSVASALPYLDEIDCAILDVVLKDGTSYPIAEALTERGVPFAFATGHANAKLDCRFKCAPLLNKPYGCDEMAEVVGEMLRKAPARPVGPTQ